MLHPAVLTLSLAVFATMLGNCMVMSFLPIYVQQFGFGELGAGLLFSVHAATRTLILPFTGRLSDRWERKYFLLAGLFFYTATSFAYLPADTVASFILIMIVHGTATAIMHPVAMAYVGDLAPAGQEGRYSGALNTAMLGGVAGGPLLGGVIKDVWGHAGQLSDHGRPEPGRSSSPGSVPAAHRQQRQCDAPRRHFPQPVRLQAACRHGLFSFFLRPDQRPDLGVSAPAGDPSAAAQHDRGRHSDFPQCYCQHPAPDPVRPAGRPGQQGLSDRAGRTRGALGLAVFPFAGEFWHLLVLNIWVGAMYGLAFPSHTALAMEHGQRYGMGTVMSLLMMAHGVGMMVGPAVFGSLASQSGLAGAFWIGGSAGAVLTVVCAVLVNTDRPRPAARPAARTQPAVAD